ncbi:MAG: type I polyketide synthase [Polyangiaceae bacterium]|nr:type I polyketide synthase [Polyangiaceae bacterium]
MAAPPPIAIVGIGCNFPGGASSPDRLWSILCEGRDVITRAPGGRPGARALSPDAWGGFLDDVWQFDAGSFGLSRREAEALDPQQRLLLQSTWDALADAGIAPRSLSGSRTGVFVALSTADYATVTPASEPRAHLGSLRSGAAGRIAFALNSFGPAVVIDSDRSSGLVAVLSACTSLRAGECDVAIVGAANVILDGATTAVFAQLELLAADGRCKFADARADGFARSEGVATVVLQPLDRALSEGSPIYAVIRGGAVMSNGNSAGDLLAQSVAAQERLLREAYARAGVSPGDVTYVEAHGTGTPLGDRVELAALERVLGSAGRASAAWIGSVKTNIGHTEACAGLAGLVKVALAAAKRRIPASLHFRRFPDGICELQPAALRVATELVTVEDGAPFVAGVSSFGLTGVNAHAVVSAAPPQEREAPRPPRERAAMLCLSASGEEGLRQIAARHAERLRAGDDSLFDLCAASAVHRDHLHHRAVFVVAEREAAIAELESFSRRAVPDQAFIVGRATWRPEGRVVFVFPGQGSQWPGMGVRLLSESPAFARKMEECDREVRRCAGWSLLEELESAARFGEIDVLQPLLVAMQVSLAEVWRSWGVVPDAVVGTSMGEVAAAHVAGALSLGDAFRVIVTRARLMRTVAGGAMAVVEAPVDSVSRRIEGSGVCVAAINSPTSTVIAGERELVDRAVRGFEAAGVVARLVRVDVASHSAAVEPILAPLVASLESIAPRDARIPLFSTVETRYVAGGELTARYWARNLRRPVSFAGAVEALAREGAPIFVEVSPHPVLRAPMMDCLSESGRGSLVLFTCERDKPELAGAAAALGRLHTSGYPVSWDLVQPPGRRVRLPAHAWAPETYRPGAPAAPARDEQGPTVARLRAMAGPARVRLLAHELTRVLAQILKADVRDVDPGRPVRDHGLTSVGETELRATLGAWLGRHFPSSLTFNHPTIHALAAYLAGELDASPAGAISMPAPRGEARSRAETAVMRREGERESDALAIVGMAFRFPGGASCPETLWSMLAAGRDAIVEVPPSRWDAARWYDPNVSAKGRMHTKWGGFVDDIGRFDAELFDISPREAMSMDPQQRVLLELTWEALESARTCRARVRGSSIGVFVGMMNNNEYARRKAIDTRPENVAAHTGVGDAMSVAAGRISYVFGLHGPAIVVDTACSSSLVALHVAAEAIRSGDCEAALVAGVNVIAHPTTTLAFAKTRMLSPTGKCRTFDAGADGYVRGEGGCVLLLKPLARARAEHDEILAVVRATAVNQDGRGSGLTAPNGKAQQALLRHALAKARIEPDEVSYIEAHGTGTPLGDPIEIDSIVQVFRETRSPERPLAVGEIKASIGHLEACAGLAGVVKVIVAMQRREIPMQANLTQLSSRLDLPEWLVIPRENRPWSPRAGRRVAGVSSFGFSGTNAHVIVEEPPLVESAAPPARDEVVLPLSAVTPRALAELARRYLQSPGLCSSDAEPASVASSASRREPLAVRAAVIGRSMAELREGLSALAEERGCDRLVGPAAHVERPLVAFVYPEESGFPALAAVELYRAHDVFRDAIDACTSVAGPLLGVPLGDVLLGRRTELLGLAGCSRALWFAFQHAVTCWWRHFGVEPDFVAGQGRGELAAACAAGIWGVEAAIARLVARGGHGGVPDDAAREIRGGRELARPRLGFVSGWMGRAVELEACEPSYWERVESEGADRGASWRALIEAGCRVFIEIGSEAPRGDEAERVLHLSSVAGRGANEHHLASALGRLHVAGVNVAWDRLYAAPVGRALPPYPFGGRTYWVRDETAGNDHG